LSAPNTHLALYADDTALLVQSWRTDTIARRLTYAMDILHRYFTKWKLRVSAIKTEALLFTKRRPIAPPLPQFQHTMIPWSRNIRYLGLTLGPKLLFTKHLHTVTHKATGVLLQLFPLLARDSTLTILNKLTLYKLMIRSLLTYAGPVWSNTSQSNYRHIQILQSKCLRVIGDYPRRTPIHYLHSTLSLEYIHTFIYRLTEKFFQQCTTHSNPLISQIGNYSLPDLLAQYRKYTHKRTKHLLL